MIYLSKYNEDRLLSDFEQAKSLNFISAGNCDCGIMAEIFEGGELEEDKSLMFVIDKSNIELYETFSNFFGSIKKAVTDRRVSKSVYANDFDINELFDEENNQIKWPSESGVGPNKDTVLFIKEKENKYNLLFVNKELCEYNDRYLRYVGVCGSGSRSDIFHPLFIEYFRNLQQLPVTIPHEEAQAKILKKKM